MASQNGHELLLTLENSAFETHFTPRSVIALNANKTALDLYTDTTITYKAFVTCFEPRVALGVGLDPFTYRVVSDKWT